MRKREGEREARESAQRRCSSRWMRSEFAWRNCKEKRYCTRWRRQACRCEGIGMYMGNFAHMLQDTLAPLNERLAILTRDVEYVGVYETTLMYRSGRRPASSPLRTTNARLCSNRLACVCQGFNHQPPTPTDPARTAHCPRQPDRTRPRTPRRDSEAKGREGRETGASAGERGG